MKIRNIRKLAPWIWIEKFKLIKFVVGGLMLSFTIRKSVMGGVSMNLGHLGSKPVKSSTIGCQEESQCSYLPMKILLKSVAEIIQQFSTFLRNFTVLGTIDTVSWGNFYINLYSNLRFYQSNYLKQFKRESIYAK